MATTTKKESLIEFIQEIENKKINISSFF